MKKRMKIIFPICLLLLFCSCKKSLKLEFTGITPGVKNGVFLIKTTEDSTVFGTNIKDGKFELHNLQLKYQGYYLMLITNTDSTENRTPFEVYLEPGTYQITTELNKLYRYPQITSPSKIQQQISAYQKLTQQFIDRAFNESKKQKDELKANGSSLKSEDYKTLVNKSVKSDLKLTNISFLALSDYAKTYPNSDISAHMMAKMNYTDDPAAYYNLFKTFNDAAKNSDDGKELNNKLSHLVKLVPGAVAPAIVGKTPDGKIFDQSKITSGVILVDFWRASNDIGRRNHQTMIDFLKTMNDPKKFTIVSVSIDTKVDWWTSAIAQDNITWPQVCDLKGDDSPNAANWSITKIPTYYLVSKDWKIIDRDIDIQRLDFEVNDYLKHHPNQ